MKKITLTAFTALLLFSCGNKAETDKAKEIEKKVEEAKCRAEFSKMLLENSINTQVLLQDKGYGQELKDFQKMQADTLISCDSLKKVWNELSDKALK